MQNWSQREHAELYVLLHFLMQYLHQVGSEFLMFVIEFGLTEEGQQVLLVELKVLDALLLRVLQLCETVMELKLLLHHKEGSLDRDLFVLLENINILCLRIYISLNIEVDVPRGRF